MSNVLDEPWYPFLERSKGGKMGETNLLRVALVEVEGLFGLFDHRIELKLDDRVTILHGPNGIGKTSLLRMVNGLMSGRFGELEAFPFRKFSVAFTDGSRITVVPQPAPEATDVQLVSTLERPGVEPCTGALPVLHGVASTLSEVIPWLSLIGSDLLFDAREDEQISTREALSRYRSSIEQNSRLKITMDEPGWMTTFRGQVKTLLIEAQRLQRLNLPEHRYRRQQGRVSYAVNEAAADLKERVAKATARYLNVSQTLDQTFPGRLLAMTQPHAPEVIIEKLAKLDQTRAVLKEVGLLFEGQQTVSFDAARLDDENSTQRNVMTLYVQDTEKKLEVLQELAERATPLLENLKMFQHKRVRLDTEQGLIALDDNGRGLKLTSLSSGEQHEILLQHALLFQAASNTLVLIDEPELSLHVQWQKRFVPDLLETAKAAELDVLVATHSPFIGGARNDLMIGIGAE